MGEGQSDWIKIDEGFFGNRKIFEAGADGALLFLGILVVHRKHGNNGVVPAKHGDYLGLVRLGMPAVSDDFDHDRFDKAMKRCVDAGLVVVEQGGDIMLPGWAKSWAPSCSRCDKPVENPRKKTCNSCLENRKQQMREKRGDPEQPARSSAVPDRSRNDMEQLGTSQEERRGEEKRVEEKRVEEKRVEEKRVEEKRVEEKRTRVWVHRLAAMLA